jgi:hypothetical protein
MKDPSLSQRKYKRMSYATKISEPKKAVDYSYREAEILKEQLLF